MKRFSKKYIVILASALSLFSCAKLDEEIGLDLKLEKPASLIVDEKVRSYDVLSSYSGGIILGSNATIDNISGSTMATLLSTNFGQVSPQAELYSNNILLDDGTYDYSSIEDYLEEAEAKGLSVYGSEIVSNLNQNDTYLKSTIEPFSFLTPLFPNKVSHGSLEDGTFTGWNVSGDVSLENYLGHPSIKMVNGANVTSGDATALQSPVYQVEDGANFEVTFYLLSTQVGEGRVTFTGLNDNEPELDWMGNGLESETFTTKIGWNIIKFQTSDFDESGEFSFKIELGYTANTTYFMNIKGLSVVNLNGSVDNPDEIFLECEDAQEIGDWMTLLTDSEDNVSGGEYLTGIIEGNGEADDTYTGNPSEDRNKPFSFTYTFNVNTSGTYSIWVRQRARIGNGGDDSFFMSVDGAGYFCPGWPGWGDDSNTSTWTWLKLYTSSANTFDLEAGEHTISIKIREGDHQWDKIYLTMTSNEPTGLGSSAIAQEEVNLEVSDESKKAAIELELNTLVSNVLTTVGGKINAWTVVKNPFAADGSVAKSGGSSAEGTFYWADYIGDEYIAEAFAIAKSSAASGTKLFVGETDLHANSAKLTAVVNTLNAVADIDGVAVSLTLDLDSDLSKVGDMFEDLAATGKLVAITNLSIAVDETTEESFALQSEAYKTLVNYYKSNVPAGQQYGISLSNPVDDAKGLWDSGYNRKLPYAGFAVGLGAQE